MPRVSRNLIGSVFIHNMVQGLNRESIFNTEYQKRKYKKLMNIYSKKHNVIIIAYCIMNNHAHILTYSEDIKNISLFMKEANTEYARFYNKSNDRVGYVFRNRFNAKPIDRRDYLLKCIKYIHMNPVKAGISKKESDYKFSSYNNYNDKNKIINSNIFKIVFYSNKDYLESFYSMKYESLNLKDKSNIQSAIKIFLKNNKITINQISKDKILIKKFISFLVCEEYRFTKQDIAKILEISRSSLYRKIK